MRILQAIMPAHPKHLVAPAELPPSKCTLGCLASDTLHPALKYYHTFGSYSVDVAATTTRDEQRAAEASDTDARPLAPLSRATKSCLSIWVNKQLPTGLLGGLLCFIHYNNILRY